MLISSSPERSTASPDARWAQEKSEFASIALTGTGAPADTRRVSAEPPAATPAGSDGPVPGQVSGSMTSTLLRHVRGALGDKGVEELLDMAGVEYTPEHLDDVANWIWYDEAIALFEAGAVLTDEEQIGLHVGEETVRRHAGTPVATLLR